METTVKIECFVLIKHDDAITQPEAVEIGLRAMSHGSFCSADYEAKEMTRERRAHVTRYFNCPEKGKDDE